jgi:hypothetical protein
MAGVRRTYAFDAYCGGATASALPFGSSPLRTPTASTAEGEFRQLRQLGVDSYPPLLLHTCMGVHRLGGPVSSAASLTEGLERHLVSVA